MSKKHLSVIFVPHTKTSTKTVTFSKRSIKTLLWGSGILGLALVIILIDYVSMSGLRRSYKRLTLTAAEQTEKLADYEHSINQLQLTIANFEEYAKKLNIMAGLKSPDVMTGPAGLGGGSSDGLEAGPNASDGDSQVLSLDSVKSLNEQARNVEGNLGTLMKFFESESMQMAATPTIMPTAGWLSSPFGYRDDPFTGKRTMHWGVDIVTNVGNPIVSTADGIVLKVQSDKILGNYVMISHGYGLTTVYGHMSKFAVKPGQKVQRGHVIGYIGMTGKANGPHVHYEVRKDGRSVNPYHYFLEE